MDSLKELYGGVPNGNRESFYLFVGRISEEKGIRTLIRAWKKLGASSRFKLVILGEGPLKSELEHSSRDMENISWVGVAERRSEEHTSELQSRGHLVCRLLLEKKKEK